MEYEREERNEGCAGRLSREDGDFATWLDSGWYSYISPQSQFDFDDDLEKAYHIDPWPWEYLLAKWRPIAFDLWRRLRKF